jgi:large repetitive protein
VLAFAPGETTKTITIVVTGDKEKEGKETFFVKLWGADNALLLDDLGVGAIFGDD